MKSRVPLLRVQTERKSAEIRSRLDIAQIKCVVCLLVAEEIDVDPILESFGNRISYLKLGADMPSREAR